jgi:hypothetical protein
MQAESFYHVWSNRGRARGNDGIKKLSSPICFVLPFRHVKLLHMVRLEYVCSHKDVKCHFLFHYYTHWFSLLLLYNHSKHAVFDLSFLVSYLYGVHHIVSYEDIDHDDYRVLLSETFPWQVVSPLPRAYTFSKSDLFMHIIIRSQPSVKKCANK